MFKNKILAIFTVKNFVFYNNKYYTYGGFGSYLSEISSNFKKVHLVAHVRNTFPPEGWYDVCHVKNLEVFHLLPTINPITFFLYLPHTVYVSIRSLINVNIVHVRMPDFTGVIGGVLCIIFKIPYFTHIIADWKLQCINMPFSRKFFLGTFMKVYFLIYLQFERYVASRSIIFAQGRTVYSRLYKLNKCIQTISTAHYNHHITKIQPKCNKKIVKLLTVGRLNTLKNHALIIDAIKKLNNIEPNIAWKLSLIGTGPLYQFLHEHAAKLCILEHISFEGKINYGDPLFSYFDDSDIFVLSSLSEGTPKVLLESLARSLPVVSSEVSGVPDIIKHKERGLLFRPSDVDGLVDCILLFYRDQHLRTKCQKAGLLFAQKNTIEKQTSSTLYEVRKYFKDKNKSI